MNSFNDQNMSSLPSTDKKDSFPVDIEVDLIENICYKLFSTLNFLLLSTYMSNVESIEMNQNIFF
jgi:hypothetical protein